jgi:hypothetical protein
VAVAISFVLIIFNLYSHFKNIKPQNDIQNTVAISNLILKQAGQTPFAILFYSNRSLSDSHLRYFLTLKSQSLEKIDNVKTVFLICEHQTCLERRDKVFIDSYCLPRCPDIAEQKEVVFADWQIEQTTNYKDTEIVKLQKN